MRSAAVAASFARSANSHSRSRDDAARPNLDIVVEHGAFSL
jgi:hypothetical protein